RFAFRIFADSPSFLSPQPYGSKIELSESAWQPREFGPQRLKSGFYANAYGTAESRALSLPNTSIRSLASPASPWVATSARLTKSRSASRRPPTARKPPSDDQRNPLRTGDRKSTRLNSSH